MSNIRGRNVLVLGGGLQGISVSYSLCKIGCNVYVYSSESAFKFSKSVIEVVYFSLSEESIIAYILTNDISVIIPMSDKLALWLSEKKEAIENILEAAQYKKQGNCKALIVTGCLAERYRDEITAEFGKGAHVQRYKGLGEMNAHQLWETTMNPDTRILRQVNIENAAEADRIFSMLMGDDVPPRREFIEKNAHYANIDA